MKECDEVGKTYSCDVSHVVQVEYKYKYKSQLVPGRPEATTGTSTVRSWFPDALRPYFPYAERYMWPVTSICQTVTIWTVLLVTVDRYMAVCRPFDTRMRTVDRATKLFVGVVVAAILYNIPRFFERKVVVERNVCTGMVS